MTEEGIVRADAKGRVTLPKAIRDELNIEDGTPFFVKLVKRKRAIILTPVLSPWDILGETALEEYRAGETTSLVQYAENQNT